MYVVIIVFFPFSRNLLECACSTLEGRDQVSVNIVNRIIELAPGLKLIFVFIYHQHQQQQQQYEQGECLVPQQAQLIIMHSSDFQTKVVQSKGWLSGMQYGQDLWSMGWVFGTAQGAWVNQAQVPQNPIDRYMQMQYNISK